MLFIIHLFYFILFHLIIAIPQINLDLTDWVSDNENNLILQHDCLHVAAWIEEGNDPFQIISYCISENSSNWSIEINNLDHNFTFAELYRLNITSQQLYLWSAPLDIIERYQIYLNQLLTSNTSSSSSLMATQLFYNCTSPRFGPLCQYSLDNYESDDLTLNEIIRDFYLHEDKPTTLTCYLHLECDRGSRSMCLDWSEICDGIVDCRNGIDEEPCWQLETNECEEDERQCQNGQCISKIFWKDVHNVFNCLDRSDELQRISLYQNINAEPMFATEDIVCSIRDNFYEAKFTSSCVEERNKLLEGLMFSDTPNTVSDECYTAVKCRLKVSDRLNSMCRALCLDVMCTEIINKTCPDFLYVPSGPIIFGHVYFIYSKQELMIISFITPSPHYVCYNHQLCDGFDPSGISFLLNDSTCRRPEDFPLTFNGFVPGRGKWLITYVVPLYKKLAQCNTVIRNDLTICDNLNMYRCFNSSKCIPKSHRCDSKNDCDFKDDEDYCSLHNDSCLKYKYTEHFKCPSTNQCISIYRVNDGICDCEMDEYRLCDEEDPHLHYIRKHISFATICDGFTELIPFFIDGQHQTDETECEYWQCNNTYTRCDGFWNCLNGADEVDCDFSPILQCPRYHHICVSQKTNQFVCLPLKQANDGNIDCFGATDEPQLCRSDNYISTSANIYCNRSQSTPCISHEYLCHNSLHSYRYNDKLYNETRTSTACLTKCNDEHTIIGPDVENFFHKRQDDTSKQQIVHFSFDRINNAIEQTMKQDTKIITSRSSDTQQRCHRGLALRVWLDSEKNLSNATCLCPPSYHGNMCQYQNQRVSLTLHFLTYSDSRRILFAVIVSLIDDSDERLIHSHQQFSYLYVRDCKIQFNMYLLYSTRPKDQTKHYSVHIDIYEKISLTYRGSFFTPLQFPFLPVHRVTVQLTIPRTNDTMESCSNQPCVHGQCLRYAGDSKGVTFCHCNRGWCGRYCTIPHHCSCSPDSLCIGVLANNQSLCVCPYNKWGSQCLLRSTKCHSHQNTTCHNGGQCIPADEHVISNRKFKCICRKGFTGDRCEIVDNKIIISFHKDIILPETMLVHFIRMIDNDPPENGTTFTTIPIYQNEVTIHWSRPFHIVFIKLFHNSYYLIVVQKIYNQSMTISRTLKPSDRCPYLNEVLNETIVQYHLLRRIKYYHLPCQRHLPQLSCFYDDNYFCLCDDYGQQRLANCFEFNHTKKFDCFGQSNCENGAECLQDNITCPQTSMCLCQPCFYGGRCQFSSRGFGFSLDAILGYHIQPHVNIGQQPSVVKVSLALTMIMTIAGLINGILSMMTFNKKKARQIGCGIYLISSSITTLIIMTIFVLKFLILLIAQMTSITNRLFLQFQCISIDFFLQICLNMNQWLNACIAIERAVTPLKGANFNKKKSKQMAKYIILILLLFNIGTTIHDPIHRRLINDDDDDNEKRIWCIVTYSSKLQIFNTVVNIFHFSIPFIINLISGPIIIIMIARQRTALHPHQSFRKVLCEQSQRHSHLLITPIVLVILAVPRLIISFVSSCMNSMNKPWLFLIGYFVSFMPSMLTFVVFVLPSKAYKKDFWKTYERYKTTRRTRIHVIS